MAHGTIAGVSSIRFNQKNIPERLTLLSSLRNILLLYMTDNHDVGVKRYFDPFDTRLLRALPSRNP